MVILLTIIFREVLGVHLFVQESPVILVRTEGAVTIAANPYQRIDWTSCCVDENPELCASTHEFSYAGLLASRSTIECGLPVLFWPSH